MISISCKKKKNLLISLLPFILILSSCGYGLRTELSNFNNKEILFIANNSDLNLKLVKELELLNNNINKNSKQKSDLTLKIITHKIEKYSGSLGEGARTTSLRMDYYISYEISDYSNTNIESSFKTTRYLDFNQSDILAMNNEENIVSNNFVKEAVKHMEFVMASNKYED
ncbi:MAG TPA: hypothetical protein QF379_02375 [SAR86 cluster bacterium]|nr:hypothetical protein [SAR86 cluster bacterium]|tara:strand:+ start:15085 stop:15594 length:510 start_codon:yes stop_codon:yes gene_type:complete